MKPMPRSAVLAHWLLHERLNVFCVLGCVLCIVGSVTIVLHAPEEQPIRSLLQVWRLAQQPGAAAVSADNPPLCHELCCLLVRPCCRSGGWRSSLVRPQAIPTASLASGRASVPICIISLASSLQFILQHPIFPSCWLFWRLYACLR